MEQIMKLKNRIEMLKQNGKCKQSDINLLNIYYEVCVNTLNTKGEIKNQDIIIGEISNALNIIEQ